MEVAKKSKKGSTEAENGEITGEGAMVGERDAGIVGGEDLDEGGQEVAAVLGSVGGWHRNVLSKLHGVDQKVYEGLCVFVSLRS